MIHSIPEMKVLEWVRRVIRPTVGVVEQPFTPKAPKRSIRCNRLLFLELWCLETNGRRERDLREKGGLVRIQTFGPRRLTYLRLSKINKQQTVKIKWSREVDGTSKVSHDPSSSRFSTYTQPEGSEPSEMSTVREGRSWNQTERGRFQITDIVSGG